ncbi:hypothetical protein SBA4_1110006 [Candidatus Sulfopaludibacter sp. SbA4]|nr:hypothetical protein SBA4_1110006 [Candidatus Sulfopaludibacter sp. SbA4]
MCPAPSSGFQHFAQIEQGGVLRHEEAGAGWKDGWLKKSPTRKCDSGGGRSRLSPTIYLKTRLGVQPSWGVKSAVLRPRW